jgi:transposase
MRFIALDVHRDFCEVAIKDESGLRLAGKVKTSVAELELFAQSLAPDDQVALEATGSAQAIAKILAPHVERVLIANTRKLRAITESKVKTDKVDASTLCELLAAGFLPAVWSPDEPTRALRRRLQRRAVLVRSRTRAKNECHAVLARNLKGKPPMSDVFGRKGRQWLAALELSADERETVECCLREVDFLDSEIALIERELAREALSSAEIRRLMTVPGVSLVSAATFVAVVGDTKRFSSAKKLVSYVGLDPKVRQSGEAPARHGRISKQGSPETRHMLCEAAWVLIRTPGPLRAFYERVRARRGAQIALVATARKLSVLFWHLLTREEDYAFRGPRSLAASCVDRSSRPATAAAAGLRVTHWEPERIGHVRQSSPGRSRPHTAGWSPTGSQGHRKAVRVRHGGALLQVIFLAKRQLRGRDQPQKRRHPHQRRLSQKGD